MDPHIIQQQIMFPTQKVEYPHFMDKILYTSFKKTL